VRVALNLFARGDLGQPKIDGDYFEG